MTVALKPWPSPHVAPMRMELCHFCPMIRGSRAARWSGPDTACSPPARAPPPTVANAAAFTNATIATFRPTAGNIILDAAPVNPIVVVMALTAWHLCRPPRPLSPPIANHTLVDRPRLLLGAGRDIAHPVNEDVAGDARANPTGLLQVAWLCRHVEVVADGARGLGAAVPAGVSTKPRVVASTRATPAARAARVVTPILLRSTLYSETACRRNVRAVGKSRERTHCL